MAFQGKCKWCGGRYEKPALLSVKSAYQGARKNYCSDKCYSEATAGNSDGGGSNGGGGNSTTVINQTSEAEVEAQQEARVEAKIDSIAQISFSSDIDKVQDILNQLTTIGSSKPDTDVRKAIAEKMEFGIMKLKNADMASEVEFFEKKMKKIKPKWYD